MKIIERTSKRIVIETTKSEIKQMGFDAIWDEIRIEFSSNLYEIESFESSDKIVLIKLILKKY
jgi:hypothetical protein